MQKQRRILAWILAFTMVLSVAGIQVFAADGNNSTEPSGVLDDNYTINAFQLPAGGTFDFGNVLNWQLGEASQAFGLVNPGIKTVKGINCIYFNQATQPDRHPHLVTTNGIATDYVWEFTVQNANAEGESLFFVNNYSAVLVCARGNNLSDWPTSPHGIWFSLGTNSVAVCSGLGTYPVKTPELALLNNNDGEVTYRITDNGSQIVLSLGFADGAWQDIMTITNMSSDGKSFTATENITGASANITLPGDCKFRALDQGSILQFWHHSGSGEFRIFQSRCWQIGAAQPSPASITEFDMVDPTTNASLTESVSVGSTMRYDADWHGYYRTIDVRLAPGVAKDTEMKLKSSASFQNPSYYYYTVTSENQTTEFKNALEQRDFSTPDKQMVVVKSQDSHVGTRYLLNIISQEPVSAGTYNTTITNGNSIDLTAYIKANLPASVKNSAATVEYGATPTNGTLSNGVYTINQTLAGSYSDTLPFTVKNSSGVVIAKNGTITVSYSIAKVLSGIMIEVPTAIDVDSTATVTVKANYTNSETVAVTPASLVSSNPAVLSVSGNTISAHEGGSATLTASYTENGVTKTANVTVSVMAGEELGTVLEKTVSNKNTTNLNAETLAAAKAGFASVSTIAFVGGNLDNGSITSQGVYTPAQKTESGTFVDTVRFYGKDTTGKTVARGDVKVTYTVTGMLTVTATPAVITLDSTSVLSTTYALDNGYNETPNVTYTASEAGVVSIEGNVATAINYGSTLVSVSYKGMTASATVKVDTPQELSIPGTSYNLYTKGSGMTIEMEEYANFNDFYNEDDEEYVENQTLGGNIIVARVYLHDELSCDTVGIAIDFDDSEITPANVKANGEKSYVYGEGRYNSNNSVKCVVEDFTLGLTNIVTDKNGKKIFYALIYPEPSVNEPLYLQDGDKVQVAALVFYKTGTMVDENSFSYYDDDDTAVKAAYKTNWIYNGYALNQTTGLVSNTEWTIEDAFNIVYPASTPHPVSLAIEAEQTSIREGNSTNLTATLTYSDESTRVVTPTYTVDQNGSVVGSVFTGTSVGRAVVTAEYQGFTASVTITVTERPMDPIQVPGTDIVLYGENAGMTIELEEYANFNDFYNEDDEEYLENQTSGADLVVARVYLHDELSFDTVGIALAFDPDKIKPANVKANGEKNYVYGDSRYNSNNSVKCVLEDFTLGLTNVLTDKNEQPLFYALIYPEPSVNEPVLLAEGEKVQVAAILFYKTNSTPVDETGLRYYDDDDASIKAAYKTNWIYNGYAINQCTGLVSDSEWTVPSAFTIEYPTAAATVTSLTVNANPTELYVGEEATLTAKALYSDGTEEEVTATYNVDQCGTIDGSTFKATSAGTATVTASFGGATANVTITVLPAYITGLAITAMPDELFPGATSTLGAVATYNDGTTAAVTAEYTVDQCGTISGNVFTATVSGTATVTGKVGEISATATITVKEVTPNDVRVSVSKNAVKVGESITVSGNVTYNDGTSDAAPAMTITAEPADAVTISGNEVTVTKAGTVRITVVCEGETRTFDITAEEDEPQVIKVKGDVNCDGNVLINDLVLLMNYFSTGAALSEQGAINADVTEDNNLLVNDLVKMLNYFVTGSWD